MTSPEGDNVEAEIGKDGKGVNVGKDIQQEIQENHASSASRASADNVVNLNVNLNKEPLPRQPRARQPARSGRLMPDAAVEIWKTISEINGVMGSLRQAVDENSRATKDQAASIKELSRVNDEANKRNELAIQKMGEQAAALRGVANAIRGMGIQIPEAQNGHAEAVQYASPTRWWKEYLTPALITILIAIIIFFMATGGHIP